MNRDARHGKIDRAQIRRLPPQRRPVPRALVIGLAATLGTILTALLASEQIGRMLREVTTAKPSLALLPTALVLASIIAVLVGSSVQAASQD